MSGTSGKSTSRERGKSVESTESGTMTEHGRSARKSRATAPESTNGAVEMTATEVARAAQREREERERVERERRALYATWTDAESGNAPVPGVTGGKSRGTSTRRAVAVHADAVRDAVALVDALRTGPRERTVGSGARGRVLHVVTAPPSVESTAEALTEMTRTERALRTAAKRDADRVDAATVEMRKRERRDAKRARGYVVTWTADGTEKSVKRSRKRERTDRDQSRAAVPGAGSAATRDGRSRNVDAVAVAMLAAERESADAARWERRTGHIADASIAAAVATARRARSADGRKRKGREALRAIRSAYGAGRLAWTERGTSLSVIAAARNVDGMLPEMAWRYRARAVGSWEPFVSTAERESGTRSLAERFATAYATTYGKTYGWTADQWDGAPVDALSRWTEHGDGTIGTLARMVRAAVRDAARTRYGSLHGSRIVGYVTADRVHDDGTEMTEAEARTADRAHDAEMLAERAGARLAHIVGTYSRWTVRCRADVTCGEHRGTSGALVHAVGAEECPRCRERYERYTARVTRVLLARRARAEMARRLAESVAESTALPCIPCAESIGEPCATHRTAASVADGTRSGWTEAARLASAAVRTVGKMRKCEAASAMLADGMPLAKVAERCGYSSGASLRVMLRRSGLLESTRTMTHRTAPLTATEARAARLAVGRGYVAPKRSRRALTALSRRIATARSAERVACRSTFPRLASILAERSR